MGARAIRKLKDIAGTVAARAIFSAALWDGVAAIYPGTPVGKRSSSSGLNDPGQVNRAPAAHSEGTGCSAPHVWEQGVMTDRDGLVLVTHNRAALPANAGQPAGWGEETGVRLGFTYGSERRTHSTRDPLALDTEW